jgi:hypothetical protein
MQRLLQNVHPENGRFNTIPRESINVLTAGETIHRILRSEFPFKSLYQQE